MKTNLIFCVAGVGLLTLDLHAAPGDLDPLDLNIPGPVGHEIVAVYATAVQRDGKIIIGGNFTSVLGVPRNAVARLNADGTLDTTFNLNLSAYTEVNAVALQPDSKVLLGGVNIRGASPIGRFNVDGMLDDGFDPQPNGGVICIAVQADGKVVLGGYFTTLQPNGAATATTRNYVARVNADGTLDMGFDPNPEFHVYSVAMQTDGKVLLGGLFRWLQPNGAPSATTRNYIARVNADGTLDTTFDPNPNFWVHCLAVQADGKVVFGGDFSSIQPAGAPSATARRGIARVNGDGTLDSGFDPSPSGRAESIALLTDGTMVIGGGFTYLEPNGAPAQLRSHIARINADGTLDTAFDPNADKIVRSITVQADGRVLIGGEFSTLKPNGAATATPRSLFARLQSYPVGQALSIIEIPRLKYELVWHRTGAGPELTRATFELSQDGGATFGSPVAATRSGTSADWHVILLSLSGSGVWRARGYTDDGGHNGSSSVVEQLMRFGPDAHMSILRLFNTGVDSAGTPLGQFAFDGHYMLFGPGPFGGGLPMVATSAGGYPIPPWLGDNSTSAWITQDNGPLFFAGNYSFETTFDLTGMDPATASLTGRWAADMGVEILLNGTSQVVSSVGYSSWTPFQITSGFTSGLNTLAFHVYYNGFDPAPGLRVELAGLAVPDLRFTSIIINNGFVTLTWISQPGRTYRVYWKATMSDPDWIALPGDVVATSGVSSKTVSLGNAETGFYRVDVLP